MKAQFCRTAAFVSALGVALMFVLINSPTPPKAPGSLPKVPEALLQEPVLPLSVMFDPSNLDANAQQLYQAMQNTMNGYAIMPADRTTYYSAVNNVNGYVVNGWQGIITNVQPNAQGNLVSIDMIPGLSSDTAACGMIVDTDYSEQYQVFADGTFQFVGAFYAPGSAGQMPTIIGL